MSGISYGSSFNPLILIGNVPDVPFVLGPAFHNVPIPPEIVQETRGVRWGRSWTDFRSPFELSVQKFYEKALTATKLARRFLFEETLDRASIIVTVNQFTRKAYSKVADSRKIVVVPIGVDAQEFGYSPMKQNYKILAIGQLFVRKGFDYAIKAMPKILRHFPESQLHIVGNGPQYGNLVALAQRLDVSDHVYFHGFIEHRELPSLYASCQVTCLPVLEEGFGMATLEAMSAGRPVISTNAVGPSEIIRHGKTGLIVPIADANALSEASIDLLGDFELSKKMGIEGRKLVEEMYDWKVIARQYYDIYTRLTS
jgi:glycosyltransferase involved in cell wall biosynthesis